MTQRPAIPSVHGPNRGHQILDSARECALARFNDCLPDLLDKVHRYCFLEAEKAANQHDQNRYFEALKSIEAKRERFLERFNRSLDKGFATLGSEPSAAGQADEETSLPDNHQQLKLVDDERLERSLTITHFATRIKMRHPMALHALKQRFAALAASSPERIHNPLGADEIGEALYLATETLKLSATMEMVFFRLCEKHLMPAVGQLFDEINDFMVEAGVLPNISYQSERSRGAPSTPEPAAKTPEKHKQSAGDSATEQTQDQAGSSDASQAPLSQQAEQLIGHIRGLLESQLEKQREHLPPAPTVARDAVQKALGQLDRRRRSDPQLQPPQSREMLWRQLNRQIAAEAGIDAEDVRLPTHESASVDLVGMLFEHVANDAVMRPNTLNLLGPLQLPLARLAIDQPDCLTQADSAARTVLSSVAELSNLLPEQDDQRDRGNQEVSALLTDALRQHADNPAEMFGGLAESLAQYSAGRKRKADLAERRQVEASKGREKLLLAREDARNEVRRLLDRYHPGRYMREVLQKCWSDVLALALLRHGRKSDYWVGTLETAEIIAALDSQGSENTEWQPDFGARWQEFIKALDSGLKVIGVFPERLDQLHHNLTLARQWQLSGGAESDRPSSLDEAFVISAQHVGSTALTSNALGSQRGEASTTTTKAPRLDQMPAGVLKSLEQLRKITFGTWFDIPGPSGRSQRAKLAWHSRQTGHCLFVNHRGARCGTDSIAELAKMMHEGTARVVEPNDRSLLDRALEAIRRQLGKLTGRLGERGGQNELNAGT